MVVFISFAPASFLESEFGETEAQSRSFKGYFATV